MAKICNVCNKSYPDDLAVCPHCSSAVDLGLPPEEGGSGEAPVVRLEGAGASISRQGMTGSDSEIDLGEPSAAPRQAEPISGASSTAWASLVEQKPPDDEGPGQLEFDSPSAQDLRGPSVPKPPPPGTEGEEAVVFEADDLIGSSGALKRGDTSDSGNILADSSGPPSGASMVRWDSLVQDQPREPLGTEAEIRIDSPSDADLLRYAPPPAPEEELSGVGLGPPSDVSLRPPRQLEEAARADLGAEASIEPPVIDLTDEVFAAGTSDINLDSGRSATGADLGPKTPLPEPEAVGTGATQLPDISGSAVNLGERPSGRDRIAEAVESGVDLDQLDVDVSPSGAGASVDSSAVDLGGPFRAGTSGGEPSSGAVAAELLEMDENAETRRSVEARPAPETPREGRGQDEGSGLTEAGSISGPTIEGRAAREEIAEEGAEEPTEFEEAAPEAASRKEKVAGRPIGAWLGGGAVGAAVGVGACVLLWLVGLVPSGSAPPGRSDQPQPPAVPPAPAAVMGLRASLNHLQRGDLDQALQGLQEAGEEPERLAARGEARWLQYVRQQRAENKPLQADDEPVRQAIEDLKKANTADALFWMGHIQQRTGAVAEALKTYQEAAERFKDDPVQRRRFQTAIDRLKLTAPADAATSMRPGERFKEVQQLALVLVALQPPASAPPGGAEPNEPGFEFWKALLLAQEGKYADALKALEQARALHERQRDLNPRQVRNPLSDPDEAIFLKACDELKAYWLVRQQLQEKGYLDPQRPDAVKALQDLPSRKEAATLKAAADELRKAKEAVAKNAEALQAKVKEVEALQAKVKDAEKAAADARKSAEAAQKTVKDLADKVKAAEDQRQAAEDRLKAVAARLEAAGVKPDDPAKGVDELAAARKAAEAVLNDLARKLKEAKQLSADALAELVQNRPAPKQLETSTGANPLMAEEHYAAGLRAYRARDYATAEKEFLAAIENDSQDARYHYYLGLARLGLNKRDEAFGDFEQGARLEAQGRPGKRAVSAALERVQGLPRLTVNRFRP